MENQVCALILKNGIMVKGATLLTAEEAENIRKETLAMGCWWWLKTPVASECSDYIALVKADGSVHHAGCSVFNVSSVRPALKISKLKGSKLQIGDQFQFGDRTFEIVSADRALCTEIIGMRAFREGWKAENPNDYEISDVGKFIDEWYGRMEFAQYMNQ